MEVEHFQFGEIIINNKTYKKDLIIFPGVVMENWWRRDGHAVCLKDIQEILTRRPEVVIFGAGTQSRMVIEPAVEDELKNFGIIFHVFDTNKAVNIYNAYGDRAVAALHLTC